MLYYFDSTSSNTPLDLCAQLSALLQAENAFAHPLVIMCIGSDRSTGDSLGPIIGYKLEKYVFKNVFIYGSLNKPIHASNLENTINDILKTHDNPYIIAIDASLGKSDHIGYITLGTGPLRPGLGVRKKLPEIGNLHITGIVNTSGRMDNLLLQTTRLSTIMTLADIISSVLISIFSASQTLSVCPYTQPAPVQPFPQRLTS